MMTRLRTLATLALSLALALCSYQPAFAQTLFLNMQSAAYSATNAQTIKVITGNAKTATLLMQYSLGASAAGSVQIEYGTGTTCGTGTTVITGVMATGGANGAVQAGNGSGVLVSVPIGNDICVVSVGTATFGGHMSYLQY